MSKSTRIPVLASLDDRHWYFSNGESIRSLIFENGELCYSNLAVQLGEICQGAVVIAVPSHWCYTCTIPTPLIKPKLVDRAVEYEAENLFPLRIEDLLFWKRRVNQETFVIAVDRLKLTTLVNELERHDVQVQGAIPAAFVVSDHIVSSHDRLNKVLIRDIAELDSIQIHEGSPSGWTHRKLIDAKLVSSADLVDIPLHDGSNVVVQWASNRDENLEGWSVAKKTIGDCITSGSVSNDKLLWDKRSIHPSDRFDRAFLQSFAKYSTPLALIFILFSVGFVRRSDHIRDTVNQYRLTQREAYQQVSPQGAVPIGIADRLESILITTQNQSVQSHHAQTSVFSDLQSLLEALPDPKDHEIGYINIDSTQLQIAGTASNHEGTLKITKELRSSPTGRFDAIGAPQIDLQADGRVEFSINIALQSRSSGGNRNDE